MTPDHEAYAHSAILLLRNAAASDQPVPFNPSQQVRDITAKAIRAAIYHRLYLSSDIQPIPSDRTRVKWNGGTFDCRIISDRGEMWTNLWPKQTKITNDIARNNPTAYLLACWNPSDGAWLSLWAIPEPIISRYVSSVPIEEGDKHTLTIDVRKQVIERFQDGPSMEPYYARLALSATELRTFKEAQLADVQRRQSAKSRIRVDEIPGSTIAPGTSNGAALDEQVVAKSQALQDKGFFDPQNIIDARSRMSTSIARRRGQPAFRKGLIEAYDGRCAFSGCNALWALEAAHIIPYRGDSTNNIQNGLLLRADIHTLFDLKLLSIDSNCMTILVSDLLDGTIYEELRGRKMTIPANPILRPSLEALDIHQKEAELL